MSSDSDNNSSSSSSSGAIRGVGRVDSEIVRLNVGGRKFETMKSTLTARSAYFRALFSGQYKEPKADEEGYIFIDRDGKKFKRVISYLRDNVIDFPTNVEDMLNELEYYGVDRPQPLKKVKTLQMSDSFVCHFRRFSRAVTNLTSEPFEMLGVAWCVVIYPKGNKEADCLSVYLSVPDSDMKPESWYRKCHMTLEVISGRDPKLNIQNTTTTKFTQDSYCYGFPKFMTLETLNDPESEFLLDDTLSVCAKIERVIEPFV